MDTHITAHHTVEPDDAALDAPLSARLPGEPCGPSLHDAAPGDPAAIDASGPAPQPCRRSRASGGDTCCWEPR